MRSAIYVRMLFSENGLTNIYLRSNLSKTALPDSFANHSDLVEAAIDHAMVFGPSQSLKQFCR